MTYGQGHGEDDDRARLLVGAEPLGRAERICRRTVGGVLPTERALEPEADPARAAAIEKVLAKRGVSVCELRRVEGSSAAPLPPAA